MICKARALALSTIIVFSINAEAETALNKFRENLRDSFQKAAEYINTFKPAEGSTNPFDGEMFQATFDVVKDGFEAVATEVVDASKAVIAAASGALQDSETIIKAAQETAATAVNTGKETWQETIGQEKANAVLETLKKNFSEVKVWTVENKELLAAGVVGLVTIGGAGFLLHKSGKLILFSKAVNNHPYLTLGSVVTALGLGAAAWYAYTHPAELQKLLNFQFN